ncbi:hypothetical protein ACLVP5_11195, partial [Streptococcus pneumoniae]
TVVFVRLRDLSGFRLFSVMSFQKTAAFVPSLSYGISKRKAVGFVLSQDFTVGRFCRVTQSQWWW